ncbi:uncharacterized protein KD926_008990 [Aspergillus affinis]|uniref:uncharacterized protein n=1 Tax=Aspergillus affinis TaxID=1070780 RepID=UPI0022FDCCEB|nr:uncharacterized protein KD926_008990 [Aspergillus affinis]KAI9039889.1 hypothetical protein KD926_008990 [Aspergillus affinis]
MDYLTFFSDTWVHEYVDFERPYPSRWAIVELIFEHPHQQIGQYEDETLDPPTPSYSQATFLCRSVREPSREAFLRVYMQVPHLGTENASHAIRSAQAGSRTHDDIEALALFRDKRAKHLPRCLDVKETKQDVTGLVPGGYMSYMLWEKLPGVRLDDEMFWSLDRNERDGVREAFEAAYKELYDLGLKPLHCGLDHLLWDQKNCTVFTMPMVLDDAWHETLFAVWELAIPPKPVKWWEADWVPKGIEGWKL